MDTSNPNAEHLAWCGLIALNMARKAGTVNSPAQENLFLCRWLATAEKKRLFKRELADDIRWLQKEGREKGMRADLPGKMEYLWRASKGDLLEQNDLFRLQHVMHAIKMTGINYAVLSENVWEGRHAVRISPREPRLYLKRLNLDTGFDESGCQIQKLSARVTSDLMALDTLLTRAGWKREPDKTTPLLHYQVSNQNNENPIAGEAINCPVEGLHSGCQG
ncbi:hypothetical protein AC790_19050 [Pantoea sp. RIT-PI-b]|nr:hypothetical protein AC790_19050 [Pantoea sp. RIT-PI-b]